LVARNALALIIRRRLSGRCWPLFLLRNGELWVNSSIVLGYRIVSKRRDWNRVFYRSRFDELDG